MSKIVSKFSNFFLHLYKIGPILLLVFLSGPRECIEGKISLVEEFGGIPDLKTCISLFWMSFMPKRVPYFLCKIGPILLLIRSLGAARDSFRGIISTVGTFLGSRT